MADLNSTQPKGRDVTPPNPAHAVSNAVAEIINQHQDALYEAHGIFECAFQFLEQDVFDASAARWAMQPALRQLQAVADRLTPFTLCRDAIAYEAGQAAQAEAGEAGIHPYHRTEE